MATTFIVEDGTGKSDANAFATVAEVDQYLENLNLSSHAVWTARTTAQKEEDVRRATQYVNDGFAWRGSRVYEEQALQWPRNGVEDDSNHIVDSDDVPQEIKDAVAEIAWRVSQSTSLVVDETNPGGLTRDRTKIGPLDFDEHFAGARGTQPSFEVVNRLLRELVEPNGMIWVG